MLCLTYNGSSEDTFKGWYREVVTKGNTMNQNEIQVSVKYSQQLENRIQRFCDYLGASRSSMIIFCVDRYLSKLEDEIRKDKLKEDLEELEKGTV
jgi:hypothetical protein